MKILITGTNGLACKLGEAYADHSVSLVSRSNGFDINEINHWCPGGLGVAHLLYAL